MWPGVLAPPCVVHPLGLPAARGWRRKVLRSQVLPRRQMLGKKSVAARRAIPLARRDVQLRPKPAPTRARAFLPSRGRAEEPPLCSIHTQM